MPGPPVRVDVRRLPGSVSGCGLCIAAAAMIGEDAEPPPVAAAMAPSPCCRRDRRPQARWLLAVLLALMAWLSAPAAWAAPGLCLGPICADAIQRSAQHPWQLRLRVDDQLGHRERITVDCRDGRVSPLEGPVERGHVEALVRRACRLAGQTPV